MPLPIEVLDGIKANLDKALEVIESLEETIRDAEVAGIDVSTQRARLDSQKEDYRKLNSFYKRQAAKIVE